MTNRSESRWLRTAFVGASLALLGAAILIALPFGTGTVEAASTKEKCASNGAVADAANNPGLVSDCAILLNAKEVLQGSEGKIRTLNWSSSLPMSKWNGVTVGGSPTRVIRLELYGPPLLAFPHLRLAETAPLLRGSIPPQLGRLSELRVLNLADNRLNGSIPPQLGRLSNLEEMWLWSNELSGKIPSKLSRLSNLKHLSLYDNNMSGEIPPRLGRLSNLESLLLGINQLSGSIPKQLGNLTKLERLWLYKNQLSGEIPPELGKLTNLEQLWLQENKLSGSIPPELGEMTSLRWLQLQWNNLSGCVPETLRSLKLSYHFGRDWNLFWCS